MTVKYVKAIQAGDMTIDDVPKLWKKSVEKALADQQVDENPAAN